MTCMEISEDGHWLVAGYTDGVLALWDCSRFRLAYLMNDVLPDHSHFCICIRFLFITAQNVIHVAVVDQTGRFRILLISKHILGKF